MGGGIRKMQGVCVVEGTADLSRVYIIVYVDVCIRHSL